MGLTLFYGVKDIPYRLKAGKRLVTTGQVAGILEDRYKIFESFHEAKKTEIMGYIEDDVFDMLNDFLITGRARLDFKASENAIKARIQRSLNTMEIEEIADSSKFPVPTRAALLGINHRLKNPYGKWQEHAFGKAFIRNKRRPSFIDTGVYRNSITVWIERT